MNIVKSIRLINTKNGSNKFYEVAIVQNDYGYQGHQDYSVSAKWGPIGRVSREANKGTYESFETANAAYQDLVQSKLAKGYVADDNDTVTPFISPPQAVKHEREKIWTESEIHRNPAAFTEALRTALKGA